MGLFSSLAVQVHSDLTTGIHGVTTKVTDWNADNTAIARILSISKEDIQRSLHSDGNLKWVMDLANKWVDTTSTSTCKIPINLPHGSVVTALKATAQEDGSTLSTALFRITRSDGEDDLMVTCNHTSTMEEISSTSISFATIDNDLYDYVIYLVITSGGTESRHRGAQLDYTVTRPQP